MPAVRHHLQTTAIVGAVLLIVSGCTHPAATPADGTLTGTFLLVGGPMEPQLAQQPGRQTDGVVSVTRGTTVVATVKATKGHFTLSLPPGTYTVTGVTSGTNPLHCSAESSATVRPKATTSTAIVCSIR